MYDTNCYVWKHAICMKFEDSAHGNKAHHDATYNYFCTISSRFR